MALPDWYPAPRLKTMDTIRQQLERQKELTELSLAFGFTPGPHRCRLDRIGDQREFVPFRRPPLKATLYLSLDSPLWYLAFDDAPLWFRGDSPQLMAETLQKFISWGQA